MTLFSNKVTFQGAELGVSRLNVVSPKLSKGQNPLPQNDGLRRWGLQRWLDHEGRSLRSGLVLVTFYKKSPRETACLFHHVSRWEDSHLKLGSHLHQTRNLPVPLILNSSRLQNCERHKSWLCRQIYGIFVFTDQTKTVPQYMNLGKHISTHKYSPQVGFWGQNNWEILLTLSTVCNHKARQPLKNTEPWASLLVQW